MEIKEYWFREGSAASIPCNNEQKLDKNAFFYTTEKKIVEI